jgi:hypothetical protein
MKITAKCVSWMACQIREVKPFQTQIFTIPMDPKSPPQKHHIPHTPPLWAHKTQHPTPKLPTVNIGVKRNR